MPRDLLSPVLSNPSRVEGCELKDWDLLIRQARHADLLGRLRVLLANNGLWDDVPEPALRHLLAAETVAERHAILVRYEMSQIHRALWPIGVPIIALKGAAYVMANLPAAAGRLFFDIDIMVPKAALRQVEDRLSDDELGAGGHFLGEPHHL